MEMTNAEKKMIYMIAPVSLFVGLDAQNPVLIGGGVFFFIWILSRWIGPWRVTKTKVTICND